MDSICMRVVAVQSYLLLGSAYSIDYHQLCKHRCCPLGLECKYLRMHLTYFFLVNLQTSDCRCINGWGYGSPYLGICPGFQFPQAQIYIFTMLYNRQQSWQRVVSMYVTGSACSTSYQNGQLLYFIDTCITNYIPLAINIILKDSASLINQQ